MSPVGDSRLDELIDELDALANPSDPRIGPQLIAELIRRLRANVVTLKVVANAGLLPAEAGPREMFRVQGDSFVYVGNGPGQPLRKIATQSI